MTFRELLKEGEEILSKAGVPDSALDSWYLFADSLKLSRASYFLREKEAVQNGDGVSLYRKRIARRKAREPLQYILGEQEFMGLTFQVNPSVLIPRQDTETLVEEILSDERNGSLTGKQGLDMCTGSGCIAVSLACLGGFSMEGADVSREALSVARENALGNHCQILFWKSDLFQELPEKEYDMIVSNPPYIKREEMQGLMPEVRGFEPAIALDGKEDGLFFYRKIAGQAPSYLKDGGRLYLETGWDQAREVKDILESQGFCQAEVIQDAAGKDRVVKALWRTDYV